MVKKEPIKESCMEDILEKDVKEFTTITQIPGFHLKCCAALSMYLDILNTVQTPKMTTDVLAAYAALDKEAQEHLGEMFTKKQIAFIGVAAIQVKLRNREERNPLRSLRDMFEKFGREGGSHGSDHD